LNASCVLVEVQLMECDHNLLVTLFLMCSNSEVACPCVTDGQQ